MQTRYRVGIIGAGVSRIHVAAFKELGEWFEVVAAFAISMRRRRRFSRKPAALLEQRRISMRCWNKKDLDVIDICTPSFLHLEQNSGCAGCR